MSDVLSYTASSEADLIADINAVNNAASEALPGLLATITLADDITVDTPLPFIALDIGDNLTIDGAGYTLSGTDGNRGFIVGSGQVKLANLTLSDFTATAIPSQPLSGLGGAVAVTNGGTLTLTNDTFSGNTAIGGGGANVYAESGATLFINSSTLLSGTSTGGQQTVAPGTSDPNGLGADILATGGFITITPGIGTTTALGQGIDDPEGAGATLGAAATQSVGLIINDLGTTDLTGFDFYSGGTRLGAGILELNAVDAAGSGAITFVNGSTTPAVLAFRHAYGLPNTVANFGADDSLRVDDEQITGFTYANNQLTLSYADGNQDVVNLSGTYTQSSFVQINANTIGSSATMIVDPAFTSISNDGGSVLRNSGVPVLAAGQTLTFTLGTNVPVVVSVADGTPALALGNGLYALYTGSTDNSISFAYTVHGGDQASDLVVVGLNLDGGSISDLNGTALDPSSLPQLAGADTGIGVSAPGFNLLPTGFVITTSTGSDALTVGSMAHFSLQASAALQYTGTPTLTLSNGGIAVYNSTTGAFDYTVTAGSDTQDLTITQINLNGGGITDAQGDTLNDAGFTYATGLLVETVPPAAPVITGISGGGSATTTKTPTLTLTDTGADAQSTVVITNTATGTVVYSGALGQSDNGVYSVTLTTPLSYGQTSLSAVVTDAAGLVSPASAPTTLTVTPAITLYGPVYAETASPVVSGLANAGDTVTVSEDGTAVGTATATSAGTWSLGLATTPTLGTHAITAQAGDGNGNVSTVATGSLIELAPPTTQGGDLFIDVSTTALLANNGSVQTLNDGNPVFIANGFVNTSTSSDAAFVARLYFGLLGRAPDPAGLESWVGAMESGISQEKVAQGFLTAPETQTQAFVKADNTGFVAGVYQSILGRTPDPAAQGYIDALNNGATRASVLASVTAGSEAQSDFASKTNNLIVPDETVATVTLGYLTGLDRAPDPAGLAAWDNALLSGGLSTSGFIADVAGSAEFQSLHGGQDPTELVQSVYQAGLGRVPVGTELQAQVDALKSGSLTTATLVQQVVVSTEAHLHNFGIV